jgi:ribosomal protein S18 acetylase RimI-like enzyme
MTDQSTDRSADMLRIRRAGPADAAMLAALGARMFEETFGSDNTPENMSAYLAKAFDPAVIARELADSSMTWLVGEIGGQRASYAVIRTAVPPGGVDTPAVELMRFYVDKPWHGSGIAHAMMRACVDEARRRGASTLWLAVFERNPRAIRFYEKVGFRVVGSQTFLLGDDEQNDRVMARPIPAM